MADRFNTGDLYGDEAATWFRSHRRGGGHALDEHLAALERLGEHRYRLHAPFDPFRRQPWRLFIEVDASLEMDSEWERLVQINFELIEREPVLRRQMRVKNPLDRIHIVFVGPSPSSEEWLER